MQARDGAAHGKTLQRVLRAAALVAGALAGVGAGAAFATDVESFTPQGTVKNVRQVSVRFSAPMVAFGDLRLTDPFTVSCAEPGSGRWLDDKNWSYDFARDLPAGISCQFALKSNLQDSAGNAVADKKVYAFSTGGPTILRSLPYAGNESIDENQVFMLGLDAPASEKSILKNVYCQVEGINEKIGVTIIKGDARAQLLKQSNGFLQNFGALYFKQRGLDWPGVAKLTDKQLGQLPIVLLQCKRSLFAATRVDLVWGAGVATQSGIVGAADQALAFRTRPEFTAQFNCERVSSKANCIPFLPMSIAFSAPIKQIDARAITLTAADGTVFRPEAGNEGDGSADYVSRVVFKGPFPDQTKFSVALPADLMDDAQRKLANRTNFPLAVATDEMPPLAKFSARFGIVELNGPALLPVTLRNIEAQIDTRMATVAPTALAGQSLRLGGDQDKQILDWFYRLQQADNIQWNAAGDNVDIYPGEQSLFKNDVTGTTQGAATTQHFQLPKPNGAKEFEVIGIPLPKPGFYIVELASPKLGAALTRKQTPMYVSAGALVTNMAAHFKHGAESSLVWVTALDSAKPVFDAAVAVRDCAGQLLWQGKTDKFGVARIAQTLPKINCEQRGDDYFISARSGDDMTFTLSSWSGGIQPWRFNLPYAEYNRNNTVIHTVFDRTLLMANDTLHMKHFRRAHVQKGLALSETPPLPDKMSIRHVGSDQTYELPLQWSSKDGSAGSAINEWKVPADAKQGTYNVVIGDRPAGSFRVEAFRLPTMKALLQGPKAAVVQANKVDLDIQLNYLAGGSAAHAPVKVRSLLENKTVDLPAYADYVFSNGAYKEADESDNSADDEDASDGAAGNGAAHGNTRTQNLLLDGAGAARIAIDKLPRIDTPRDLRAELEYRDANGEVASASTRIALWPSQYLIGLKTASDDQRDGNLQITTMVVDLTGKPVANAQVSVDLFQRNFLSHRRRLLGGFYAYENSAQIKPLGNACSGHTDRQGLLSCDVKAPASGNIILQAATVDAQGNKTLVHQDRWLAGAEQMWFDASDNDRIDVLPQQKNYAPGSTATLQVRMPFADATALITVEREGVLDTYVQQLSGKDPLVYVPIKNSYAPNVYVSVFVVRGRSNEPQPTALVDLGKPAYKMGIAELQVDWRAHELTVTVDADKPLYKIRDKAQVKIHVARADGGALPAGSEIALAAVDEGLLELKPNDSWKLLDAMMQRRPLEVETATAQMQVIGKRHFGRKAVPHGGGGGKSAARELFDALLFWNPRVALDANGNAIVNVPLNDALTTFRVVAIASGGADLFGTGSTTLRSTQDLILVGGLPPLVREGDTLRAGFTVRNTTDRSLHVDISATVNSVAASANNSVAKAAALTLASQNIEIAAGQAQPIGWTLQVPSNIEALQWDISAIDRNTKTSDRLHLQQKVVAAYPLQTLQATLVQLDKPFEMAVQQPADALPGRGGLQTALIDKLGAASPGVREYMSLYPYSCFEQQTSKAVALRDVEAWQHLMSSIPAYLDRDGLLKYFPLMSEGSDTLTAYVLSIADEAGYLIPAAERQRMLEGLSNFVQGKTQRQSLLPTADLSIRKLAALEALSRSEPVRPQLLESIQLEPNAWPTSAVLDWYNILQRSKDLPERAVALNATEQILRARLTMQGSTLGFSSERSDALWWLMVSADSNANRLILSMLDNPAWQADMGRLARGALGRQQHGHWNTTVANAWGTLALEKFSHKFESTAVTGNTGMQLSVVGAPLKNNQQATASPTTETFSWSAQPHGGNVLLPWPAQPSILRIEHHGEGKPWATIQSRAALPLRNPVASGYKITKTITAIERKTADAWSVGDVYRVHLDMEAQSEMTWVVVDDPIPAGATVLGSGLGGDSKILSASEKQLGWTRPAFEERSFEAFRAYYQFVPKGKWVLEYTVRLNNEGEFVVPSTRVEAMYAPEMFGALPNAKLAVAP